MKTTWTSIKAKLQETLDSGLYKVWIAPLAAKESDAGLELEAQNAFMASWINGHLKKRIELAAADLEGAPVNVAIRIREVNESPATAFPSMAPKPTLTRSPREQGELPFMRPTQSSGISWRYKFDDFVIGSSNHFAVAAAKDLCSSGQVRSLFVTSASGLGKTHLAQASGHLMAQCRRPFKIAYLTAENFASRYVAAMRAKDLESFKQYLCDLDALVFEDVHFLQKKKAMQELALFVIKNLEAKGARVIFTSSFAPKELEDIDTQLTSYFCSGIMANMDRPDNEMREEILRRKARFYQVALPDEVCELLSRRLSSDVRQLEACLQNMIFKARLLNSGLSIDLALETMGQYAGAEQTLDLSSIIRLVCESFGVTESQLRSRSRKHDYVHGRSMVFFLARKHTELSLESIGNSLNRRHSTVLRSITQVEKEMARESREGRRLAMAMQLIERKGGVGGKNS